MRIRLATQREKKNKQTNKKLTLCNFFIYFSSSTL